jgi:hypothetical protein
VLLLRKKRKLPRRDRRRSPQKRETWRQHVGLGEQHARAPLRTQWSNVKKCTPASRGSAGILPVMAGMLPASIRPLAF